MSGSRPAEALRAAGPVDEIGGQTPAPHRADAPFSGVVGAIWIRELRGRMRGKRAFIFITIYLAFLAGLLYTGIRGVTESPFFGALQQVEVGRGLFTTVVMVEILVIVALAPAYTAGSISQEREKQTFDLLAATPVSSLAIVVGKLLSSLSYLVLIVVASLPLASLGFFFGGVGLEPLVLAYVVLIVIALGVGSIGVACSAIMRRTQPATVATFVLVALLVIGATGLWAFMTERAKFEGRPLPPEALIWLNPFVIGSDLLCSTTNTACIGGLNMPQPVFDPMTGALVPGEVAGSPAGGLWPRGIGAWLVVIALALGAASQAISPTRRWRPPGRRPARTATGEPQA